MEVSRCPESLYTQGKERNPGALRVYTPKARREKQVQMEALGEWALHRGGVAEIWDVFEMAEDAFKRGPMCHNCLSCVLAFASKSKRI